jgi:hypothetical protein
MARQSKFKPMENTNCPKCGSSVPITPQQKVVKCSNLKCGLEWTRELLTEPVIKKGTIIRAGKPTTNDKKPIISG